MGAEESRFASRVVGGRRRRCRRSPCTGAGRSLEVLALSRASLRCSMNTRIIMTWLDVGCRSNAVSLSHGVSLPGRGESGGLQWGCAAPALYRLAGAHSEGGNL